MCLQLGPWGPIFGGISGLLESSWVVLATDALELPCSLSLSRGSMSFVFTRHVDGGLDGGRGTP